MQVTDWLLWGALLIAQNFAFTFVSRARNSGSLRRHLVASMMSNGIWFCSQTILLTQISDLLRSGLRAQIEFGLFYSVCTIAGAMSAHWWALRSEKGSASVGASKRYAQIPTEEWDQVKLFMEIK